MIPFMRVSFRGCFGKAEPVTAAGVTPLGYIKGRMIKVASYNMRKGIGTDRRRRPDRTLDVLCEIDADIICLQEADRRFGGRGQVLTPHLLADRKSTRLNSSH